MTKKIFAGVFSVGVIVLLLCAMLFFAVQYKQRKDELVDAMRQETIYAEQGVLESGTEYLERLDEANRITWIDAHGEVLFDSVFGKNIGSQKKREEVAEAFENGSGWSIRKSGTNGVKTIYYAEKCEDGTILRLSRPHNALRYALNAVSPVFWILVLVILISGVLAFRVSRLIVKPINEMDLDDPNVQSYAELKPLVEKIQEQKLVIQEESAVREEMRREFTANVSHELKTPLTSISGFAELMSQGGMPEDQVIDFSKDIFKESQRLMVLIDDIIRLSRLDENAVEPEAEEVDLYELSSDVLDSLRPVAEKENISLILQGRNVKITGVYSLLNEMVYNLCDNAIKYNRQGGSVTVTVTEDEDHAELSVRDIGIGIPKEHLKRVFERFYRVDKSHSKEVGGTGLGLSIVKHGALYHHANVELNSEEGSGTEIKLIFPKHIEEEPEKESEKVKA